MIFRVVKSEGVILCNELKILAKYGLEKAQSRKEAGTFCEAFGVTKIEDPSSEAKRAKKSVDKRFERATKPPPKAPPVFNSKPPSSKKKKSKKKPVVCYKCGKPRHKAFQCKIKQQINELFADQPNLQKKLLAVLAQNSSGSDKDIDYYQSLKEDESESKSSPIKTINALTNRNQKEFLIDLIGKISDEETKKEYLSKLKDLILEEEKKVVKLDIKLLV